MNAHSTTPRKHNEKLMRSNNIVRNLASRNAGKMILMVLEHELRALDQARFTPDVIYFDSTEGHSWMDRVFQEQLHELEGKLFDAAAQSTEKATKVPAISTNVPSILESHLGLVQAVLHVEGARTQVKRIGSTG